MTQPPPRQSRISHPPSPAQVIVQLPPGQDSSDPAGPEAVAVQWPPAQWKVHGPSPRQPKSQPTSGFLGSAVQLSSQASELEQTQGLAGVQRPPAAAVQAGSCAWHIAVPVSARAVAQGTKRRRNAAPGRSDFDMVVTSS